MLPDLRTGGSGRFALLGADAIAANSDTIQMFNQYRRALICSPEFLLLAGRAHYNRSKAVQ
jgi:hypothetical protein